LKVKIVYRYIQETIIKYGTRPHARTCYHTILSLYTVQASNGIALPLPLTFTQQDKSANRQRKLRNELLEWRKEEKGWPKQNS
jgi:hypothetical protein